MNILKKKIEECDKKDGVIHADKRGGSVGDLAVAGRVVWGIW